MEDHRLRAIDSWKLRKVFGPERQEVTAYCGGGSWFIFRHRVLSGYQIKVDEMGCTSGTYGGEYKYIRCFNREPEGKRIFATPANMREDNIKTGHKI
jgi:hypothetical protein